MSKPLFLRVRNWEKFQYRTDKRLPWIRNFDAQLEDYEYTSLSDAERGRLHDIRLLANRTNNKIPNDPVWIARATRSKHVGSTARAIAHLIELNFLEEWLDGQEPPANEGVLSAQSAHNGRTQGALDLEEKRKDQRPLKTTAKPVARAKKVKVANRTSHHDDLKPLGQESAFAQIAARAQAAQARMND